MLNELALGGPLARSGPSANLGPSANPGPLARSGPSANLGPLARSGPSANLGPLANPGPSAKSGSQRTLKRKRPSEILRKDKSERESKKQKITGRRSSSVRLSAELKRRALADAEALARATARDEAQARADAHTRADADALALADASRKSKASSTIASFMRRTKHTRRAQHLTAKCFDAGACLALGTEVDTIKKHFNNFTPFDYVIAPILKIGKSSENGFIHQIEYKHGNYSSYAILKSAKTPEADNLLYEYIVGQYINKLNKQYPCFLETYGYYQYKNESHWQHMESSAQVDDARTLKYALNQITAINYDNACRNSKYLAILIQHLKGIRSFQELSFDPTFIAYDMLSALFQLYLPLANVKDTFTHYDLHLENLYLYEPVVGKYIQYHYHISERKIVTFKSRYMLKIIDYGRSYFNDIESGVNSRDIYDEKLCKNAVGCATPESGDCGSNVGFGWLKPLPPQPESMFYISSQRKNISHDLLPLTRIILNHTAPNPNLLSPPLVDFLSKVDYMDYFGTKEEVTSKPGRIVNVQDAANNLMKILLSAEYIAHNEGGYTGVPKLGDLHIHGVKGKPMRFIPA